MSELAELPKAERMENDFLRAEIGQLRQEIKRLYDIIEMDAKIIKQQMPAEDVPE